MVVSIETQLVLFAFAGLFVLAFSLILIRTRWKSTYSLKVADYINLTDFEDAQDVAYIVEGKPSLLSGRTIVRDFKDRDITRILALTDKIPAKKTFILAGINYLISPIPSFLNMRPQPAQQLSTTENPTRVIAHLDFKWSIASPAFTCRFDNRTLEIRSATLLTLLSDKLGKMLSRCATISENGVEIGKILYLGPQGRCRFLSISSMIKPEIKILILSCYGW